MNHDHTCHCGTGPESHSTGEGGCVRFMTKAPVPLPNNWWLLDLEEVTDFTLREQRGYHQHPCGCWSRWPGSVNSIEA